MKETIFYLEGRGGVYLFHFFIYNIGGLFYILNKNFNNRGPLNTSVLLEDKSKIVIHPSVSDYTIKFPIKIHMTDVLPIYREAFEIIKCKFELVEDLNLIPDYEVVSIYGETQMNNSISDNSCIIFPFLRNLFLENCDYKLIKGKRCFITRKNSESTHNGILKRCILNEDELRLMLNKYNFEFIQLEDYNIRDKIKLFMESEIILSSHGSQLVFTLFSNKEAKIIEILNNGTLGVCNNHIRSICNTLNLNYNRYSNINEDVNGNFNISVEELEKYLFALI
jgi:hypothetical protein